MRERHDGLTVGVDVAELSGLEPHELKLSPPGFRWLTSGAWLKGPPIVSVLIRSATLPSARIVEVGVREALDITIAPMLDNVQLRDWKSYTPAVEAGYRAAMASADALLARFEKA
jgi:NTE family protein